LILWIAPSISASPAAIFCRECLRVLKLQSTRVFPQIKLNAVLMRGRNEDALLELVDFAAQRKLLLRFIELMPVSATEC